MEARRPNPWLWPVLAILLVVVAMILVGTLFMSSGGAYYGMMGAGGEWWIGMMLVPVALVVLLILVLAGPLSPHGVPMLYVPTALYPGPAASALDLLNARYARGEISQEEYLRIRSDLTGERGDRA